MVNEQEAINVLSKYAEISKSETVREAYRMAISALEKQIPKKPPLLRTVWKNHYSCPFGNRRIFAQENFCSYCGQALDWSE